MNPPLRRIRYLQSAQRDLLIQADYYQTRGELDVVRRFVLAVSQTAELLRATPNIGRVAQAATETLPELRKIGVGGAFSRWVIFYRITSNTIRIHRILDGSRDLPNLYP